MRTCSKCQHSFPDDTDFCPRDGTPLLARVTATEAELAAGLARRYRIIRPLGAGGMGTVFLAEQIGVGNRPVALKVLLRKLLDDPEFLLRFHNEAASTGRIHHPNVVTIYESGQADDGTPYLAMEYMEGETLREALKRRGALPVPETVAIIQQVARGLNAAHKLGIIHRDLKPDNIFLTPGEEVGEGSALPTLQHGGNQREPRGLPYQAQAPPLVKIVDFGIAKLRESATHTLTGTVLGTPAYMSFEQASGMRSDELDARSDIYSLGILAYEMLTGRVPFHSDTPLGYVRKHLTEQPPPFRAVKPDLRVAPELEEVVMKGHAKDREHRYPSALEFARALTEAALADAKAPLGQTKVVGAQRPAAEQHAGPPSPLVPCGTLQPGAPIQPGPLNKARGGPAQAKASVAGAAVQKPPQLGPLPITSRRQIGLGIALSVLMILGGLLFTAWYDGLLGKWAKRFQARRQTTAFEGMLHIPGGSFQMGRIGANNPEEGPAHFVTVYPFRIDKTPVSNAEYFTFVHITGHSPPPNWDTKGFPINQGTLPVADVSWLDADGYCKWAGSRLPTEAEWEYAARQSDGRLYPWGIEFRTSLTNSLELGLGQPERVGNRPNNASPFGVLDMSGNVWQWCEDDYKPYPGHQSTFQIPAGAKVIRGGSYKSDKDHVTTTTRNLELPTTGSPAIGFRCAKSM